MNIEAAARALCKFAGKDPDSEIKVVLPGGAYTTSGEKLWTKYSEPAKACVEAALSKIEVERLEAVKQGYRETDDSHDAVDDCIAIVREHLRCGEIRDTVRGVPLSEEGGEVPHNQRPDVEVPSLSPQQPVGVMVGGLSFSQADVDNLVRIYNCVGMRDDLLESLFRAIKVCKERLRAPKRESGEVEIGLATEIKNVLVSLIAIAAETNNLWTVATAKDCLRKLIAQINEQARRGSDE